MPTGDSISIVAKRLDGTDRDALEQHFLALPPDDRRLRFGIQAGTASLRDYVASIDFDRDAVFGVFSDDLSLAGVAHVAVGGGIAELGVSVLPGHRQRGVGSTLFERAHSHARNQFIATLFMHCLTENRVMMHIARKSGMTICAESGEADAYLALPPLTAATLATEIFNDRIALFDYAMKSQLGAARRFSAAMNRQEDEKTPV